MERPYNSGIERRVYWHTDGGWYDVETDVKIANLHPGDLVAPSQSETFSEEATRALVIKITHQAAAAFLNSHVVMTDHYFINDPSKLVSYAYVREVISRTHSDMDYLRARIEKLERPWWKRWFSR